MIWLDTLVQGVLLGGLYALFAAGLSLVFGVMRLVNLAHGDLIVLAAFLMLGLMSGLGLDPFLAALLAAPLMFALGFALQLGVLNRTLGGDILRPRRVEAAAPDDPLPIPGGSPTLGGAFHVYGPSPTGFLDPIDAEPASITNFNGVVGMAYIDGMVTQTRISNGEQARYPFVASDMRFMQGVYRGADGKPRQGTFGFI